MSKKELHAHLAVEISSANERWRGDPQKLADNIRELSAAMGDGFHSRDLERLAENVEGLAEDGRDARLERKQTFIKAVHGVTNSVSNHLRILTDLQGAILEGASDLDIADARIGGIMDQRRDLAPQDLMRVELAEAAVENRRRGHSEDAAREVEARRKHREEFGCQEIKIGDSYSSRGEECTNDAKVTIEGKKLCGVHANAHVRRANSEIKYQRNSLRYHEVRRPTREERLRYEAEKKEVEAKVAEITRTQIDPIKSALAQAKKLGEIVPVVFPTKDPA